jgi:phosphatidylglycerophosphate synthase
MRRLIQVPGKWALVNLISGSRLVFSALFVFCALDPSIEVQRASLVILIFLLVSDFLDGALARRWKVSSKFGFVIDGLGDRAAYIACLLVMSHRLGLPLVITYLIVLRDIVLYAARSLEPQWMRSIGGTRSLAKIHAGLLRVLFAIYFVPFYLALFGFYPPGAKNFPGTWGIALAVIYTLLSYASLALVLRNYRLLGSD